MNSCSSTDYFYIGMFFWLTAGTLTSFILGFFMGNLRKLFLTMFAFGVAAVMCSLAFLFPVLVACF